MKNFKCQKRKKKSVSSIFGSVTPNVIFFGNMQVSGGSCIPVRGVNRESGQSLNLYTRNRSGMGWGCACRVLLIQFGIAVVVGCCCFNFGFVRERWVGAKWKRTLYIRCRFDDRGRNGTDPKGEGTKGENTCSCICRFLWDWLVGCCGSERLPLLLKKLGRVRWYPWM